MPVGVPDVGENSPAHRVAAIQGRDCLVQKFRNSSVMLEHPSFRPKVGLNFHTYPYTILMS